MNGQPPPPQRSQGHETRHALKAVLEDQIERNRRQDEDQPKPKGPSRGPAAAAIVLGAVAAWVWISPPSWVQPRPIPPPPPVVRESGLRMDVYMVALRIGEFQSSTGALPVTLEEVLSDSIQAARYQYSRLSPDVFRLVVEEEGQIIEYSSDQPLEEFVGTAPLFLRGSEP